MSVYTLLNKDFITSMLTVDDPWCSSHGSDNGSDDLNAGLIYYALAYSARAKTCVCLGSGGGFVPRMMRQAQRDLNIEGSRTFLVDGAQHPNTHQGCAPTCFALSAFSTYPDCCGGSQPGRALGRSHGGPAELVLSSIGG